MKAVIQRVKNASVAVNGETVGKCGEGLMVLFGAETGDTAEDAALLAKKTAALRIFCDENGKMNRSLCDINGEMLVISQFTLCADVKKGNRPRLRAQWNPKRQTSCICFTARNCGKTALKALKREFSARICRYL